MIKFDELIRRLYQNEVEFILIGGFAATVYGVSVLTQDIDVCVPFNKQNVQNIYKALTGLNPVHRSNHLPLNTSHQRRPPYRNLYLQTSLGPIDFMGEILNIGGYSDLLPSSITIELFGMKCKIIDLETLIHCKDMTGRNKDKEVVLQLRAIREKLYNEKKIDELKLLG